MVHSDKKRNKKDFQKFWNLLFFKERINCSHGFSSVFFIHLSDQNSSNKISTIFYIVPVGPRNWTKMVFPLSPRNIQYQERLKGPPFSLFELLRQNGCWKIPKAPPPFSFFGIVRLFFKNCFFIKGSSIHQYFDILKPFCYFWALDMAPTWAGPGLF